LAEIAILVIFQLFTTDDLNRLESLRSLLFHSKKAIVKNALLACAALMPDLPFAGDFFDVLASGHRIPLYKYAQFLTTDAVMRGINEQKEYIRFENDPDKIAETLDGFSSIAERINDSEILRTLTEFAIGFCNERIKDKVVNSFSEVRCESRFFRICNDNPGIF
jgi:hypothetical protein